jgi:hypothetical protein
MIGGYNAVLRLFSLQCCLKVLAILHTSSGWIEVAVTLLGRESMSQ